MNSHHTTRIALAVALLHGLVAGASGKALKSLKDDQETLARAERLCPDLLKLRLELDELYAHYRQLKLTFGTRAARIAAKQTPRLKRTLEKKGLALKKLHEKALAPLTSQTERIKKDEGKLLERISKLEDRGRDTSKYDAELDKIVARLEELETATETVERVGVPMFSTKGTEHLALNHLIKPDEREEATLSSLMKKFPKLIEYRLKLEHLRHDLATARSPDPESRAAPLSPEKVEKSMRSVERSLRNGVGKIRAPYDKQLAEITKLDEKLTAKVERAGARASALKYQQQLNDLAAKVEGVKRTLKLLDRFSPDYKAPAKKKRSKKKAKPPAKKADAKGPGGKKTPPDNDKGKKDDKAAPKDEI
ncbi:MAG: hypothetical protein HN742_42815 [Lentisphaerae bacterium]|jgi:hypothetical protein|nr:hypothetical protein [Lentisphaerota bacterium]MBT4814670.1 hypothetical protein [Lentisphaerota bacterium]MBT5609466.1 hypothetical protein [Lentisphaerota bacterium]MBT7061213.1 hypothetical protein [Lentisphaerota bacterium]MBT7848672.1 hypothetical protein [Lentisphaerota bacterium]